MKAQHLFDNAVADGKRADLDVFDGKNRYIVEVKEKLETDSKVEHTTVGESDSIVHVRQEPHSRSNRLDGVFKRGAAQLAETPCASDAFMLILLHSEGPFADITVRRALITYYGIAVLMPCSQSSAGVNCVYFHDCTSYSRPSVNGLIIAENKSLQLCLNEFSANYANFKSSDLVRKFGEAVYDPSKFESKEGTIVLHSDISRHCETDVLAELERATGVRYRTNQMNHYTYW